MQKDDNQAIEQLNIIISDADLCTNEVLFNILPNGDWLYQQSPLPTKFARLFASILHRKQNSYFLITPVEKVKVEVEAHAFLLVDFTVESMDKNLQFVTHQCIKFGSSVGVNFTVPMDDITVNEQSIEVVLPRGLTAKLNRSCYYCYINEMIVD